MIGWLDGIERALDGRCVIGRVRDRDGEIGGEAVPLLGDPNGEVHGLSRGVHVVGCGGGLSLERVERPSGADARREGDPEQGWSEGRQGRAAHRSASFGPDGMHRTL